MEWSGPGTGIRNWGWTRGCADIPRDVDWTNRVGKADIEDTGQVDLIKFDKRLGEEIENPVLSASRHQSGYMLTPCPVAMYPGTSLVSWQFYSMHTVHARQCCSLLYSTDLHVTCDDEYSHIMCGWWKQWKIGISHFNSILKMLVKWKDIIHFSNCWNVILASWIKGIPQVFSLLQALNFN
jgi:hypothetical protein